MQCVTPCLVVVIIINGKFVQVQGVQVYSMLATVYYTFAFLSFYYCEELSLSSPPSSSSHIITFANLYTCLQVEWSTFGVINCYDFFSVEKKNSRNEEHAPNMVFIMPLPSTNLWTMYCIASSAIRKSRNHYIPIGNHSEDRGEVDDQDEKSFENGKNEKFCRSLATVQCVIGTRLSNFRRTTCG